MDITLLQSHLPQEVYDQIPGILSFGIDGPKRLSHILGQCKHETGNWKLFTENLSYSGAALWKLFHTHFKDQQEAESFAHDPERTANRIYANRMGNGDEASGDGWNCRGRGALQTTGRKNYTALGNFLNADLISNPDLVATDYQLASAAFFFFKTNNLWTICDNGVDFATVTIVTHHINGGELGLTERYNYTTEFYHILTGK